MIALVLLAPRRAVAIACVVIIVVVVVVVVVVICTISLACCRLHVIVALHIINVIVIAAIDVIVVVNIVIVVSQAVDIDALADADNATQECAIELARHVERRRAVYNANHVVVVLVVSVDVGGGFHAIVNDEITRACDRHCRFNLFHRTREY